MEALVRNLQTVLPREEPATAVGGDALRTIQPGERIRRIMQEELLIFDEAPVCCRLTSRARRRYIARKLRTLRCRLRGCVHRKRKGKEQARYLLHQPLVGRYTCKRGAPNPPD